MRRSGTAVPSIAKRTLSNSPNLYVYRVASSEKSTPLTDHRTTVCGERQADDFARNVGAQTDFPRNVSPVDVIRHEHVLSGDNPIR